METNKYFTPDIQDIRVGDECIIKAPKYEGKKFIIDEDQVQYAASCIRAGILFIPYLTKEQIEAEGWEIDYEAPERFCGKKEHYRLNRYKMKMEISSFRRYDFATVEAEVIFYGECKDINTFRYICKLLEI